MATRRFSRTSAQQVDPLSWFTGPYLPLAFTGLIVVAGSIITVLTWSSSPRPWLQIAGLGLCLVAGLFVHARTRPLRPPIGWGVATLALTTATVGTVLSALDYRGTDIDVAFWWGPAAPALILVGLSPYLAARTVATFGVVLTVLLAVIGLVVLAPSGGGDAVLTTTLKITYPPAMATAGATVFSYSVVSTMIRMLESPSRLMVPGQTMRDAVLEEQERVTLARLTARAAPFLESIAETGRVTPEDRALAGQLARRIRDDLVTRASESWLDSVAAGSRLVVVDPDRLARRMTTTQRTALLAMLRAILELPETDAGSLLIELRTAADGSTAAAISMDMTLPEGRRIMHLAPYYLTLRAAVDDLSFDRDRLTFRIPPQR